jgi:ferredoxin
MDTFHVEVDAGLCGGLGACLDAGGSLFELGDDGIARALVDSTDDERVIAAAQACPMAAIRVHRASGEQVA